MNRMKKIGFCLTPRTRGGHGNPRPPGRARTLRGKLTVLTTVAALTAGGLGLAGAFTAGSAAAAVTGSPRAPALSHSVQAQNNPRLLHLHYVTIRGSSSAGRCTITPPRLRLAPGQKAIEADEISVSYGSCASVWQIGEPVQIVQAPGTRHSSASRTLRWGRITPSLVSSSGYEYAWTTDIPGFTLTSDKSNISWAWDGSCVRAASGSANWTWGPGWSSPYNNGVWIYTNCSYSDVWSQSTFRDSIFCWPRTVYSNYTGVYAEGWYDGALYGWVDSMSYSNSCLPLYLHSQLVRVTG